MNRKQKLSLLAASVLPMLALSAYFVFAPQASAGSCPDGSFYSPCANNQNNCANGAGGCFANGSKNEPYQFCYHSVNGQCIPGGPGSCSDGCVTCADTQCTP